MSTQQNVRVETSHDDLEGGDAVEKIRSIVNQVPTCFFATSTVTPGSSGARPMMVQDVDDEGNLWFISAIDTHKDREAQISPEVRLYFQSQEHSEFLEIQGRATVSQDRKKIEQLWKSQFDAWFEHGKEDPRVSVIRVAPEQGHYWDSEHGGFATGMRMMLSNFFLQRPKYETSEGGLQP